MTEEQDNAGEVVAGAVRVALTAAGQLAEQTARRREADLREAERDSAVRVTTLQSQLAAERELALREVRDTVQRGDTAPVKEVLHAWERARSWDDPALAVERAALENSIMERFGVDAGSGVSTNRLKGEHATTAIMVARDVEMQTENANRRRSPGARAADSSAASERSRVVDDAATAMMLAAQSYPAAAAAAARKPEMNRARKPWIKTRNTAAEMDGPGR